MNKSLISILLISSLSLSFTYAFDFPAEATLKSSTITYHMKYMLKNIYSTSTQARGKGACEKGQCNFIVAALVKSFESKDSGRDTNTNYVK